MRWRLLAKGSRALRRNVAVGILSLGMAACHGSRAIDADTDAEGDPAEVVLGERLFLETRFAQSFAARFGEQVNPPFGASDPVVDVTVTTGEALPGPFGGLSMNCRACHLVDEQGGLPGGGVRTYADFARRSPVPNRGDGHLLTARNSPALVNASLARDAEFFLHLDGEFTSAAELVRATFTGRNFGWLPGEEAQAVAQIARVVRGDDGQGSLAKDFGGFTYRSVFAAVAPEITSAQRLPPQFRIDVDAASDDEVVDAVAAVVGAYVESLTFAQDDKGQFTASPYDTFLRKNDLPGSPKPGESAFDYSARLLTALKALEQPKYVSAADGSFALHEQEFVFAATELRGLQVFLARAGTDSGVGNCVSCHPAPNFTDFRFHNTGASQDEYDTIHGSGAFAAIDVPTLAQRRERPQEFLPPSSTYPLGRGVFLDVPAATRPGHTDLGLWNVFANDAVPRSQAPLQALLCRQLGAGTACTADELLPRTIAFFKTPGLRSLGQSAPYLHSGQKDSIADVVQFYVETSALARAGRLRNASPELLEMRLSADDVLSLTAFLRALNEDYS